MEKIMTEFVALGSKTYSYLKDDSEKSRKIKITKKCVMRQKFKIEDY